MPRAVPISARYGFPFHFGLFFFGMGKPKTVKQSKYVWLTVVAWMLTSLRMLYSKQTNCLAPKGGDALTIWEPVQVQKDTSAIEKSKLCLQIAVSMHVRYSLVVNLHIFPACVLFSKCPVPLCVNINSLTGVLHFLRVCNIFHLLYSVSWSSKRPGRTRIRSPISKMWDPETGVWM